MNWSFWRGNRERGSVWRVRHNYTINYASPTCKSRKQFWLSQLALTASQLVVYTFENTLLDRQACSQDTFATIMHLLPLHWINSFEVPWSFNLAALGDQIKPDNVPICFLFALVLLLQAQNHSVFIIAVKCLGVPKVRYCEGKQNSWVAAIISLTQEGKKLPLTCVNH